MVLNSTRLLRFAGGGHNYTFSQFQRAYRDNFSNLVTQTNRVPGVSGGFNERGDDPLSSAIGDISIQIRLVANTRDEMTALRDQVKEMASWGMQRLFMQPSDPNLGERWCDAVINNIDMPEKRHEHTDLWQEVSINFHVPFPFWHEIGTENWSWGDGTLWGSKDWGGSATPKACSGLETEFAVDVAGSATTNPRITIACGAGQTASNPQIERIVGGVVVDRIAIPETLVTGDSYEINCRAKSFKKNGVDAYTSAVYFNHYDLMQLPVGTQTIRVKFDNPTDAASVTMRWFTLWR